MAYVDKFIDKDTGKFNKAEYAKKIQQQQKAFATIDSAMAVLKLLPSTVESANSLLHTDSLSFTYSTSPLQFLLALLKTLGVKEEELKKWISEILVYALPAVEMGIKGALLTNLKTFISCNADPRIPLIYRKHPNKGVADIYARSIDRGFVIGLNTIDPDGILSLSPYTEPGYTKYFGIKEESINPLTGEIEYVNSKKPLARPEDFNAFLWYVMHKANKQNPIGINPSNSEFIVNGKTYVLLQNKNNLRGVTTIECVDSSRNPIESGLPIGTTFYDVNSYSPNVCIVYSNEMGINGQLSKNTIVEVSSDWMSCNWYADKSNYFKGNIQSKDKNYRDFSKDMPICNVRYVNGNIHKFGTYTGGTGNNFVLTILPKPLYLLPFVDTVDDIQTGGKKAVMQTKIIRLLFDENGNPDSNGRYSVDSEGVKKEEIIAKANEGGYFATVTVKGITVAMNTKTGKYWLVNKETDASKLVLCYKGLTVYEFNYDYVMSMRLLDPKVVCQRLFDLSLNPAYNANFTFTLNREKDMSKYPFYGGKQRLLEVVRSILNEDDEINDCFFSFSNEKYEQMLSESDKIAYNRLPYDNGYGENTKINMSDINEILEGYPENGTLEEQKYVIERALETATGKFSDTMAYGTSGIEGIAASANSSTIKVDFLTDILEKLTLIVVDSILTPKVLMLFAINKQMMGDGFFKEGDDLTLKDLLSSMQGIVKSLIREVRDLIMEKILDYIIASLVPTAVELTAFIESERFAAYMAIITLLLRYYTKGIQTFNGISSAIKSIKNAFKKRYGSGDSALSSEIDLPSVLDDIMYADIYASDLPERTPIIEKCD